MGFCALVSSAVAQSHGHINAGAKDTNGNGYIDDGDKLFMYFETGTQTTVLNYNSGANVYGADGYLWNGNTTLTALHQSSFPNLAPDYNSVGALSGSYLIMELVSVSGPIGAKFAFYEPGGTEPTFIYEVGRGWVTEATIYLTEDYYETPSDPYGHVHGRMFAVDTAGDYTVSWRLHDNYSATTGLLDSDVFTQSFTAAAVPEPSTYLLLGVGAVLLVALRRRMSNKVA